MLALMLLGQDPLRKQGPQPSNFPRSGHARPKLLALARVPLPSPHPSPSSFPLEKEVVIGPQIFTERLRAPIMRSQPRLHAAARRPRSQATAALTAAARDAPEPVTPNSQRMGELICQWCADERSTLASGALTRGLHSPVVR